MYIAINYKDKRTGEYGGRPYTYETELDVKPGDLVVAPTAKGDSIARVVLVEVPETSIPEHVRPLLKSITRFAPEETADE